MTEILHEKRSESFPAARLFALSFMALFLELITIRWVPAVVPLVAYYGNLMLISSFLGLGLGAMMAGRRNLIGWFPAALVVNMLLLILCRGDAVIFSDAESRFYAGGQFLGNALTLLVVFFLNVVMFVPLGQVIGQLFRLQPPLKAYASDLAGSLCGTLAFGFFSLSHFSPAIGFAVVAVVFLATTRGLQRWLNLPVLALAMIIVPFSTNPRAIWSPYYYVTVAGLDAAGEPVNEPPLMIRTMMDPPVFKVAVNTNFYQEDATANPNRYTPGPRSAQIIRAQQQYFVPYGLDPKAEKVCVVGSGGGVDVEAAILSGATSVDAVEIDPTLIQISHRFNPSGIYDDPRVHVFNNDARAFFETSPGPYDHVVFGLLDSQTLFSYSNNIRLDGYIYTVQSIRRAYSLLKPDGLLSISFNAPRRWLAEKLRAMVREATGREPLDYALNSKGQQIICVWRSDTPISPQEQIGPFALNHAPVAAIDVPTDDWPYLYIARRTIPIDYLTIIGCLLMISVATVLVLRHVDSRILHGRASAAEEGVFFFLGAGFMLLETRSIGDCSLYFGTTWLVTLIVVSGVLINVLAANLVAMRLRRPATWAFVPVLLALLVLYFTPRDWVLGLPRSSRFLWALLIVPLPIFFAGLIFSTTFRESKYPAIVFGANLIGATVGGFFEYAGMALGTRSLLLFVMAAYVLSFVCMLTSRRIRRSEPLPQTVAV